MVILHILNEKNKSKTPSPISQTARKTTQITLYLITRCRDAAALDGHSAVDFNPQSIQSLCFTDNVTALMSPSTRTE